MRQPARWMDTGTDDRIMEHVAEEERAIPESIASETGYTNKQVAQRCRLLAAHGLLEDTGNGFYVLTEAGEQYLAGDLDASTLERREE